MQSTVGEVVGVTQQAISAMVVEGKLPDGMPLGATIQAYCQRLREQAAGRLGSELGALDLAQERAALAREQRRGHEIKNAVARGTYAPIALLAEVLAAASQAIVERLDTLPGALKKAAPDMPDSARETIMTVLASARNQWVRETEELVVQRVLVPEEDDGEPEASDLVDDSAGQP